MELQRKEVISMTQVILGALKTVLYAAVDLALEKISKHKGGK